MTRPKPADGTLIDLRWDEPATEWYVYGHVSDEVAIAAVRAHLEEEAEEGDRDHVPELGFTSHICARWGLGMDDQDDVVHRRFYPDATPGRGAFPVTVVVDLDERQATRAAREAERAHAAQLEAWVLACYPGATEIKPHGYPPGDGYARFRLPGLEGHVDRKVRSPDAWVEFRDLDAWARLYGRGTGKRPTFDEFVALSAEVPSV